MIRMFKKTSETCGWPRSTKSSPECDPRLNRERRFGTGEPCRKRPVLSEHKAARIATNKFDLRIAFKNGGRSQLLVSRNRLAWTPLDGAASPSVQVNTQHWKVESANELLNRGSTRYFLEDLSLETATLMPVRMRGTAKLTSVSPEELAIELNGDDEGEFIIKFGP